MARLGSIMDARSAPARRARPLSPAAVVAVLAGGFVGTGARLGVDLAIAHTPQQLALSTLVVNVVGSFLLGLLIAATWGRLPVWGRAGLGAGLLGSFTTFSALTDSLWALVLSGAVLEAVVSVVLTLTLGLGAAVAGLALGRRPGHVGSSAVTDGSDE
ncbi:fluoride efflux transporter FluC [Microcella sp.]|uniref:fluoride efflux transporter FluC n=1 Tax=Microcella sp. TaxID=1913979 RepID=UPI0039194729